jgi:predicted ATP-dependent endonuclease of OLD family
MADTPTAFSAKPLKIVSLEMHDFKRIKAVRIVPKDDVVAIGGENEQGKTSIFDFIRSALGGAKATPDQPIRRGAAEAGGRLDLGDLIVDMTIDASGRRIVLRNADGKKTGGGQALLDSLYDKVAFDPLAFATKKPDEQQKILKKLVGLDFSELEAKRAELYTKRTGVGSVRDDAEVRIGTFPPSCVTAPDEEVSVVGLMAEYEHAEENNTRVSSLTQAVEYARQKVLDAEEELAESRRCLAIAQGKLEEAGSSIDTETIANSLKGAEDVNRIVRAKKDRAKAVEAFKAKDREYADLTKQIGDIDAAKENAMERAPWPIPGLGFSKDGITFNKLPFEQSSKAERMKVSLSIGAALNPQLRVLLLEDASLLDKASMKVVYDMAREKDMQIWIERVGDGDEGAVIIEDGEVVYSTEV